MSRTVLFGVSIGLHAALAIGLGEVRVEKVRAATAIEIAEVAPPPLPEPETPEEEPPPPEPERIPEPVRRPVTPAAAPEPAPDDAPPPAPGFDTLPDLGLSLGGGASGGLAVARRSDASPRPRVVKQLEAAPSSAKAACEEAATKPKPLSVPQPVYTDAARSAGIEGKVRVELTVDEKGHVVDVKVLKGLGYGLDEAAIASARSARFEPALRCGRPTRATFKIAMSFSAG